MQPPREREGARYYLHKSTFTQSAAQKLLLFFTTQAPRYACPMTLSWKILPEQCVYAGGLTVTKTTLPVATKQVQKTKQACGCQTESRYPTYFMQAGNYVLLKKTLIEHSVWCADGSIKMTECALLIYDSWSATPRTWKIQQVPRSSKNFIRRSLIGKKARIKVRLQSCSPLAPWSFIDTDKARVISFSKLPICLMAWNYPIIARKPTGLTGQGWNKEQRPQWLMPARKYSRGVVTLSWYPWGTSFKCGHPVQNSGSMASR